MATVQQTTQLEFHQAMADFKTMFPAMDDDVIEAVLRSNQGAVDATIDQLLSMTTDNENDKIRHQLEAIDTERRHTSITADEQVIERNNSGSNTGTPKQLTTDTLVQSSATVIAASSSPTIKRTTDSSIPRLKDNTLGSPIAVALTKTSPIAGSGTTDIDGPSDENASGITSDINVVDTTPLRLKKCWCPPLLGPLPDDFLRLTPICTPSTVAGFNKIQTESELEDERIALFLQNEEFMAELRWNKDFLLMLDKDSPPEERLSNFPLNRPSDDDAVFKERLRNMGKMSRKKFSQLARVFTGRKKRSSAKQILTQGTAPSRDNLLLQEEDSDGT